MNKLNILQLSIIVFSTIGTWEGVWWAVRHFHLQTKLALWMM